MDTAWLTDLGVEHMCDKHRKSKDIAVCALIKGIRDAHLFSPFEEIQSVERVEAETCVQLKNVLEKKFDVTVEKTTIYVESGHATRRVLDLWCEEYAVNIECNEHGHKNYPKDYDKKRKEDICSAKGAGVLFYDFNPHVEDFDLGKLIADLISCFENRILDWGSKVPAVADVALKKEIE